MRRFLLALVTLFLPFIAAAQDFNFGNYSIEELSMKSYAKDTSVYT